MRILPSVTTVAPSTAVDVLILHSRPFDAREQFKERVVQCLHSFIQRAPSAGIRNLQEQKNWDLGADANLSLVSVVLATCLEEIGASYKVWDMDDLLTCAGQRLIEDLRRNPKIIAISSSHFTTELQFAEFVQFVRSHNSQATVVVGGQLLRICPEIETNVPGVDYFVHGDAEVVFPQLVETLLEGRHVDLPGVRCRSDSGFRGTRHWEPLSINELAIPRWDLTLSRDFNDYAPTRSELMPMVFIEEMRGCVYRCSFCSYPQETGFRLKSPERIAAEIRQYVDWGLTHFNFYSALFTSPPKHCRKILEAIIELNVDITFSCQARIDNLYQDPGLVGLLKRAGCIHISTGIESGDRDLLRRMRKPLDVTRIPAAVRAIHEAGISLCANFFIGFPGETRDSVDATYALAHHSNFQTIYLSSFVVEKAAEVFRNRDAYGLEVSEDGRWWSHDTMDTEQAEAETVRFFCRLARDDSVETVIWVVQWRLARFLPSIVAEAQRADVWNTIRLIQKGVANELEFMLEGGRVRAHHQRQDDLWRDIMSSSDMLAGVS